MPTALDEDYTAMHKDLDRAAVPAIVDGLGGSLRVRLGWLAQRYEALLNLHRHHPSRHHSNCATILYMRKDRSPKPVECDCGLSRQLSELNLPDSP